MVSFVSNLHRVAVNLWFEYDWSIIPTKEKKPACAWKRHQEQVPEPKELRDLFSRPGVTGLAVITGRVSGRLVCRDFDTKAGYTKWARKHPTLAAQLPTVRTKRGYHVYFSGPEGYEDYGNGEYRGDSSHYVLLPPSAHPDGGKYKWLIPLSGPIPKIDPRKEGLRKGKSVKLKSEKEITYHIDHIDHIHDEIDVNDVNDVISKLFQKHPGLQRKVDMVIKLTVPDTAGKRNRQVFNMARQLKRIREFREFQAEDMLPIVRMWFKRGEQTIGTKDFETTWADFRSAWERVQSDFEGGLDTAYEVACEKTPPTWIIKRYNPRGFTPRAVELLMLCRELSKANDDGKFHLSQRQAALQLGVSQPAVHMYLRDFRRDRVIEQVGETDVSRKLANVYRYLGRPKK